MRTPAQAMFAVADTVEELEPLLPAELYEVAAKPSSPPRRRRISASEP
ncbi:hypothetical protein [Paractinoplanes abujensis]|uniref:Uncharacterized protein n=1 Tax=Paractinoplanes abujensis TaxID=882441 RepID=A0A7W7CQI0_9ACTN|nr:hypothetical protein [Actinoplanes abujensis]MBB4692851.1 hypothetical protein [Actinoplanes abujensis]